MWLSWLKTVIDWFVFWHEKRRDFYNKYTHQAETNTHYSMKKKEKERVEKGGGEEGQIILKKKKEVGYHKKQRRSLSKCYNNKKQGHDEMYRYKTKK